MGNGNGNGMAQVSAFRAKSIVNYLHSKTEPTVTTVSTEPKLFSQTLSQLLSLPLLGLSIPIAWLLRYPIIHPTRPLGTQAPITL